MHILVLFVNFLSVSFAGKSGQTFLMNINSQRLIGSYAHIDTKIKFVTINEQGICYVLAYN